MPNVARWNDVLGRKAGTSDLSSWTSIDPTTVGDRDGVLIHNQSANYLFLVFKGSADSAPSGSTASDAHTHLAPGESKHFDLGAEVGIYGLHGSALSSGYSLKETN